MGNENSTNLHTNDGNRKKNQTPEIGPVGGAIGGLALGIGISAVLYGFYHALSDEEPVKKEYAYLEEQTPKPTQPIQTSSIPVNDHDKNNQNLNSLTETCPPSFLCPISQEIMRDPVLLTSSGMVYDRKHIEQWLGISNVDPMTSVELTSKDLVPIITLRNAIEEWCQMQGIQII